MLSTACKTLKVVVNKATAKRHVLKSLTGVTTCGTDAAAAPPRIFPTTLDTNDMDGAEIPATMFKFVVELCEAAESNAVGLVPRMFPTKGVDADVPILETVGSC